jgi:hypothetical protein
MSESGSKGIAHMHSLERFCTTRRHSWGLHIGSGALVSEVDGVRLDSVLP